MTRYSSIGLVDVYNHIFSWVTRYSCIGLVDVIECVVSTESDVVMLT